MVLPAVEINTSFYRPHRPATYARWRDSVPDAFRFAAKVPKEITHELRLRNTGSALEKFIDEVSRLEQKLGCLLVQLPPSLRFDERAVRTFFADLRGMTDVAIVCEPRHPTWFTPVVGDMLMELGIAYVEADPEPAPLPPQIQAAGLRYIRLHGSPVIYHSPYSEAYLEQLANDIERSIHAGKKVWCVFDNTANGEAVPNALSLLARLQRSASARQ